MKYGHMAHAEVAFGETYQDNTMYVYVMQNDVFFHNGILGENKFYKMEGLDRVYWGRNMYDINQIMSWEEK